MYISQNMAETLRLICHNENVSLLESSTTSANELGIWLIKMYHSTQNQESRKLIRVFMSEAGPVWLRKLLTRDSRPIESSTQPYATLQDYINLVATNNQKPR